MDRTRRCRHRSHAAGLARALAPNNRARGLTRGIVGRADLPQAPRAVAAALACFSLHGSRSLVAAATLTLAAATAGCSLSFPISGLQADTTPTGSIDRSAGLLPATLDREDLRRAKAALSVALDPQGNGTRAAWQNPQSGARGAFTAAASPFADHDRVCRAFSGEVTPAAGAERHLSGSACRDGDGSWEIRDAGEGRKA